MCSFSKLKVLDVSCRQTTINIQVVVSQNTLYGLSIRTEKISCPWSKSCLVNYIQQCTKHVNSHTISRNILTSVTLLLNWGLHSNISHDPLCSTDMLVGTISLSTCRDGHYSKNWCYGNRKKQ